MYGNTRQDKTGQCKKTQVQTIQDKQYNTIQDKPKLYKTRQDQTT